MVIVLSLLSVCTMVDAWWPTPTTCLHFELITNDFLVNIALVTGFIALVGRTRRGQALYLACVFLLCTEIGKIVAVDVLLTEKRRQCLGAGIRPTFFVDGSRLGFINDFDLCTLIGNAADNAIEATSQLPLGEARESSWCPCRPRLESARGSELPRALPLEARVHLMARRVVGGGGGEHGLLGCRSLRPIELFTHVQVTRGYGRLLHISSGYVIEEPLS